jgi:putative DNA primase/helicase
LQFVAEHRNDLRYTAVWGHWHVWDGARWARDEKLRAFSLAQEMCRRVASTANEQKAKSRLNKAQTRAAVVSLARENPALAVVPTQWDDDPWLLGTPGGAVDLRTGQLLAADPDRYITRTTTVVPSGSCPLWGRTIKEICGGDEEYVAFLRRWFGYCLTGLTREEKLLFCIGEGGNGKGTVIETIQYAMGDYATPVAMTTLVQTRNADHPTEIAKLFKVRLAVASETSDGGWINAARIKLLTGSDRLTARHMRADFFDFSPTHKLVISGNRPLVVGRRDRAIERRWRNAPFMKTFKPDTRLKEKLRAEAGGILQWLIEGCLEWQRVGLAEPKVVEEATEEYLSSQDDLAQFVASECVLDGERKAPPLEATKTSARVLYDEWRQWCSRNGVYANSFADFCDRMKARFKFTNSQNRPAFHGLSLGFPQGRYASAATPVEGGG